MEEIRNLQVDDIAQVLTVQQAVYVPQLLETSETFACKMTLFPRGAVGCFEGDTLRAYLFCHPWRAGQIVPLDTSVHDLPIDSDCMYIHDLAVEATFRGRGAARQLIDCAFRLAQEYSFRTLSLVAVQRSEPFWCHFGFEPQLVLEYVPGIAATFMTCTRVSV